MYYKLMNILFLLKQTLDICHISSADVDQDVTFHGRWEVGLNAGGVQKGDFKSFAKNPQVALQILAIHFKNLPIIQLTNLWKII